MKRIVIDYDKCVGCEMCAMRCSLEKTGDTVNPSRARIHLVRVEEEGIMMPAVCRHCDEPKCIPSCPVTCITKDPSSGIVRIDAEVCIGCKKCVEACPYGGPVGIPREGPKKPKQSSTIKVICDLCNGKPVCVDFCPTGCIRYIEGNPEELNRQKSGQEKLAELIASRK